MTETTTCTVIASRLKQLIDDAARTAGTDDTLPMLHGVLLYTAPHGDSTVLVAVSTDRFTIGQVHTDVTGHLPATFVDLDDVKRASKALALADPERAAELSTQDGILRIATPGLTVDLDVSEPHEMYSMFGQLFDTSKSTDETRVAVNARLLARFVPIAKARGFDASNIVIETYGAKRPIHLHIGSRYRAMVMPVRIGDQHAPVPLFLSPAEQAAADKAIAEQAAAELKAKRSAAAKKAAATRAAKKASTPAKPATRTRRKAA